MAEEKQGAEKRSEDTRSNAMEGFPDGVRDGVGSPGREVRGLCQRSGDLSCTESSAVCEGAEDGE